MSREQEYFDERVSPRVTAALVRSAFHGVGAALSAATTWDWLREDAVPTFRRLFFEAELAQSTFPSPAGLTIEKAHSSHHTEIRIGGVLVTSLCRSRLPSSVEPYLYRKTFASAAQGVLFDDGPPRGEELGLYALFLYGGRTSRRFPEFCQIAFPAPTGDLAPGTVDLLVRHGDLVEQFSDVEYARVHEQALIERYLLAVSAA